MLPKACAEVELWPICDDSIQAPDEWHEISCIQRKPAPSSPPNAIISSAPSSTPIPTPNSNPTDLADASIMRPASENSGVHDRSGTSLIAAITLVATAFTLL